MKKKILTHAFILSLAVAGLFVVGNNLMAQQVEEKEYPPAITCTQYCELFESNSCWQKLDYCYFTGIQSHSCWWCP